jgi:hypothetical protein
MKNGAKLLLGLVIWGCYLSSPAFAQNSAQCNTTPPSTGSVTVGQPFTIGWCDGPNDINGNPTTITGFNVYRNNVLMTGGTVITDTPNAAGQKYSHLASQPETVPGVVAFTVEAINAQGVSQRASPVFTLTVTSALGVPAAPTFIRVTVP